MVSHYLIDTDWCIDVLHGIRDAEDTLIALAPSGLAISLITYGELYEGAYYARRDPNTLSALRTFLQGFEIIPLTTSLMERFAVIRGALPPNIRNQVGDMDLLIAASAIERNLVLITRNRRDFEHIQGLTLYPST